MDLDDLIAEWPVHPYQTAKILTEDYPHLSAREVGKMLGVENTLISRYTRAYYKSCDELRDAWRDKTVSNAFVYRTSQLPHEGQREALLSEISGNPIKRPPTSKLRNILSGMTPKTEYDKGVRDTLRFVLGEAGSPVKPPDS